MDTKVCWIFIANFYFVYAAINIVELKGPNSTKYGSEEEIIFDCDFVADADRDLEIKWFYNGDRQVIYQWVPDSNKQGYAMGALKDHIDVSYTASNDPKTMYRALKIYNLTSDLSGNYTCKVSSFESEDSETKQFIVYTPSKTGLNLLLMETDQIVICAIQGVFPKPEIELYIDNGDNKTSVENFVTSEDYDLDDNDLYNVTKIYYFPNLTTFPSETKFICDFNIPGTDYFLTETIPVPSVELIEYYTDEEEYIWNLNFNLTSSEEYSNVTEGNSAVIGAPAICLLMIMAITCLLYSKRA